MSVRFRLILSLLVFILVSGSAGPAAVSTGQAASSPSPFRPPAFPLITHDPYFSIWSMADKPTDDWPKHWTGKNHALCAMVRIDGQPFRLMGSGGRIPGI